MLRLVLGSRASRLTSGISDNSLSKQSKPPSQRRAMERWESFQTVRYVKKSVEQVRPRARTRLTDHLDSESLGNHLSNIVERRGHSGHSIQRPDASMGQNERCDAGHIVDQNMIASLFPFAEDRDGLAPDCLSPKAIRPIPVVRVGLAIDQRRPKHSHRRFGG